MTKNEKSTNFLYYHYINDTIYCDIDADKRRPKS